MRPTKKPVQQPPSSNKLVQQQTQVHGGGHGSGVSPLTNMTDPSNAMDLQRMVGNQATIQLLSGSHIQRMPSDQDLIAVAGAPQKNKLFGLYKMSEKYKNVLAALKDYNNRLGFAVTSEISIALQEELLGRVEKACKIYVDDHKDDQQRTPHINRILTQDAKQEREKIEFLMTNYNTLQRQLAGKTVREAIAFVAQAKDASTMQGLMQVLQYETTKNVIKEQTASSGTMPFRGNDDDVTKAGVAFTQAAGKDFIDNVLGPQIATMIHEVGTAEYVVDRNTLKEDDNKLSSEDLLKKQQTIALMKRLYGDLITTLLVDTKGGTVIPQEILDGAAQVYARVYHTVSNDPEAQHTAMESARISVVNMIFLRFLNPAIINIISKTKDSSQATLLQLAQVFQSQLNKGAKDALSLAPHLSEMQETIDGAQASIDQIVNAVSTQGQLLAQNL